jgi:hypothetical protein
MNITTIEESLQAWAMDIQDVASDARIPDDDRERVLYETDQNHAQIQDAVTAYVQARFCTVF